MQIPVPMCFRVAWLSLVIGVKIAGTLMAADSNQLRPWNDYRTIMWIGDSAYKKPEKLPLFLQRLREMGINTAMTFGDGDPRPFVENQFPYYV
ncbi:MAG TPA: hypothetical protein VHH73_19310, partial [Verrucomicrobiae bacterium]|nr:hypothetical protein [Verrucomicrobiae bacterium]